jgi:hypothetical protein
MLHQGCQIFPGPNIPKRKKYTKWPQTMPKGLTLYQMGIKYSKWSYNITPFFYSKALQILPKVVFFVWKQTIWQPCVAPCRTYIQQRLTKLGSILTVSDAVVQRSTTQKPYKMNYLCVGKGLCRYLHETLHIFVSHCVAQQRLTKLGSILTVPDATVWHGATQRSCFV